MTSDDNFGFICCLTEVENPSKLSISIMKTSLKSAIIEKKIEIDGRLNKIELARLVYAPVDKLETIIQIAMITPNLTIEHFRLMFELTTGVWWNDEHNEQK